MKLYHQLGHNEKWNFESLQSDRIGDGVIFAPRYTPRKDIERYPNEWKQKWIFDPQFFKPDIPKGKLETYNFFPDVFSDGFQTNSYNVDHAQSAAHRCVEWQVNNSFATL